MSHFLKAPLRLVDAELVIPEELEPPAPAPVPADMVTVAVDRDETEETDDPTDRDYKTT